MIKKNNYSWDNAYNLLCNKLKLDFSHVRNGSMPEKTLKIISQYIRGNGLQIGGFVGLTHCYIANCLQEKGGTICTIDPNLTHRNIKNPVNIIHQLVSYYEFNDNSLIVLGYAIPQMKIFEKIGAKFNFILIDGKHDEHSVKNEVLQADKILKDGGFIILDDIDNWDGPKFVYQNFPLENYIKVICDTRAGILMKDVKIDL
jgi:predicted O-methyltransferase YrrM